MDDLSTPYLYDDSTQPSPYPEMIRYRNSTKLVYQRPVTLAAACFAVLFIIVGIVGNSITIIALTSSPKLRRGRTTPFVINLCASHLLFCFFYLPFAASRYLHEEWIHGKELCSIFPFFFYGVVGVSMMTIMMIAINRYILINHYRVYHRIYKDSNAGIMIAGCWAFSFAILLPTLKGKWGTFGLEEETFACTILRKDGKTPKTILFIFGYVLPFTIVILSCTRIICKYGYFVLVKTLDQMGKSNSTIQKWAERLRKWKERDPAKSNEKEGTLEATRESDELRLTALMMFILASFLCCFSMHMVMTIVDRHYRYPDLHIIASIVVWMSSSINPIFYIFISKDYRAAFFRILCPRRRKKILLAEVDLTDELGIAENYKE